MSGLQKTGIFLTAALAVAMWVEAAVIPGLLTLAVALADSPRLRALLVWFFAGALTTCVAEAAVWLVAARYGSGMMIPRDSLVVFSLLWVEAGLAGFLALTSTWRFLPLLLVGVGVWIWAAWTRLVA